MDGCRVSEQCQVIRLGAAVDLPVELLAKNVVTMLDLVLMKSVAEQLLNQAEVEVAGSKLPLKRVGHGRRLRTVRFVMNGRDCEAIEQNPEKPSRWGQLARAGHKVVQFKDVGSNRYIGVAVDGEVKGYGR